MNRIKIATGAIGLGLVAGTGFLYKGADAKPAADYRTAPVTRASLKATVAATGTLNAVRTVTVGTQVSGQVAKIYVDFNDHVRKGQLLATIDPTLQQQAVQDAEAQLERAQATLDQATSDYNRNKQLFDAKVLSAAEFSTTQSNFAVQQANVKSAKIALDRAKQNLAYTAIYSPIDGVIVNRNVDVGQTVAASLSAPTLFVIANDLSEMEILASVDEGDIGAIKEGLPVQFTVQAYPKETFKGTVKQVRLQSTTTDNVVSYTAVISVKNDGKLLPGMTATVQFLTATAENVLTVPNAALRIQPTDQMKADAGFGQQKAAAPRDSTRRFGGQGGQAGQGGFQRPANVATLWTVDTTTGKYSAIRVKTGITDGQRTEVESDKLAEGQMIVTSVGSAAPQPAATAGRNPLSPQRGPGGRGF
jgi:HlyD family secretion protein